MLYLPSPRNPTPRNLLDASGFLRRVLTDSAGPSLHKVARGRDFKPRFRILDHDYDGLPVKDGLVFRWVSPAITDGPPHLRDKEVGLDAFLSTRMSTVNGEDLTVKQLINYVANVGGGVHKGEPSKKDNARTIHGSADKFYLNGFPYPLASLVPIIKVVLEALMPLYHRVRA